MARERCEVRPGVWLWLNGEDLARFHESRGQPAPEPHLITSAVLSAPEVAVIDTPKARKPNRNLLPKA